MIGSAIVVGNQGQKIVTTNYWESDWARQGKVYLSWNAGAARLLVPDSRRDWLREMKSARYVIVSRGPWTEAGTEGLELLFEDNSDAPFCIHVTTAQTDRLLPEWDFGGGFFVTVWTRRGQKYRFPGKYRTVGSIPCLQPWKRAA